MRKAIGLAALLLIAALFLSGVTALAEDYVTTTGSVNLRKGPGLDYRVICAIEEGERLAQARIDDGSALNKFGDMIAAQGGDRRVCIDPEKYLGQAAYSQVYYAKKEGCLRKIDGYSMGMAAFTLGAGRAVKTDASDPHAGVVMNTRSGVNVSEGDALCTLYSSRPIGTEVLAWLDNAYEISEE